ncbi:glyoxalase [Devosia pacifica]|uniref:Glyoxalase n=1 Tax=Devosia pacifica TaxID=1335967 RepID=A0A918SAX7_9HYPH|nr:VOC family protein [Devosia pacifica]GHA32410.1 glyoxalase [Devosia pacifica]
MLNDLDSSAIIAVSDIGRAREFYAETLGLELLDEGMGGVMVFKTGRTSLVVYPSQFAGTNKANAVVWGGASDIESLVSKLKAKGVVFEHYPELGLEGDIHGSGDMKMIWFKDPDGNILHVNTM